MKMIVKQRIWVPLSWALTLSIALLFQCCNTTSETENSVEIPSLDTINFRASSFLKVDLDTALQLTQFVLDHCTEESNVNAYARASTNMGRIYYERGICDSAISYFRRAHTIALKNNDLLELGNSYNHISTAYMCLGEFETASAYTDSAYQKFKAQSDYISMAKAATNQAVNCIRLENYDSSKRWFAIAINYAEKTTETGFLVTLYNNFGLFHRDFGDKDTGSLYLTKSLNLARKAGHNVSLATIYLNFGQDLQKENPALCKEYLDSALTLSRRFKLSDLEETVLGAQAIFLRDQKMPVDLVGDAYEKYVDKVKENQSEIRSKAFAEYEIKYSSTEKEKENLRLQNKLQERTRKQRLLIFTAVFLGMSTLFILWGFYQNKKILVRDKQIYQQKIDALLKSQEIQNIDSMLEIQANERTRIATELHDRLGSILSALKLNFSSMEDRFDNKVESNRGQFDILKNLIDDAASEVRKISHDMASGVLAKFGLMHAVEHLRKAIEASGKVTMQIYEHGMDERLLGSHEIILYRILQELISNSLKHGKASSIDVHLTKENHRVILIVEDNGKGFDQGKLNRSEGMGLPNIKNRVKNIGGQVTLDSNPKSGTTVIIEIPV